MYKSTLLSSTAYPPNLEPEDLEALHKAGYQFTTNIQLKGIINEILSSSEEMYKDVKK